MGSSKSKHKAQIHQADRRAESEKYQAQKRLEESRAKLAADAKQKQYQREHALAMQKIQNENAEKERRERAAMEKTKQEHDKKMQQMRIDADERDKQKRIQQKNANLQRINTELNKLDSLIEDDSKQLEAEKKALEKITKTEQFMQEWISNFDTYKGVELNKVSDELQLESAKEKFEFVDIQIKAAIDKTGQIESNVGKFLNLTHHLLSATVSTTAHSNKLEAEIATFGELISRECQDKLTVAQYFKHKNLEKLVSILAEDFETLDSLKCVDDEEYNEILTFIENGLKQQNDNNDSNDNNDMKEMDDDEKKQIDEDDLAKKLLTDWKLIKYWGIMEEEGWDDPTDWKDLTDDVLRNTLKFKDGHINKFKRKLNDWLNKNKLLTFREKRLLKEICCQPDTWWKYEEEQRAAVKEGLMEISPLLSEFFTRIHDGIKQSQEILKHDTTLTAIQTKAIKMVTDMAPDVDYKDNDMKNCDDIDVEHKDNEPILDDIRKEWKINSKCEIYSETNKQWFDGQIIGIDNDNEGEWLNVKYSTNKIKQVGRFSKGIRPAINSDNKLALQCHALTTASIISINVTNSMMEQFNKNVLTARALTVAVGIEDCCMQIIRSQATIRQSVILAQEILKMRPAHMSDQGAKLWKAVDDGIVRILKSSIDMVTVSSKYFGYFLRFMQSFRFYESNSDKSLMVSLQYVHKDCSEYSEFQKDFSKKVKELSNDAMNCITQCVETAIGAKTFEEYRNSREITLQNWLNKKAIWDKKALDLEQELDQKQQEKINMSADKARLQYKVKMIEYKIKNNYQQKESCIGVQSMLNKQII